MPCGHGRAIASSPAADFAHPAISSISTFASAECSPILGWEEAISTVETEIFATKLGPVALLCDELKTMCIIAPTTKALRVQPDPHNFMRFIWSLGTGLPQWLSEQERTRYLLQHCSSNRSPNRRAQDIFTRVICSAVHPVTRHKIAPVGQAHRTGIPMAKALRAGIFAISDEYTQREPTGLNEYDEPMPQAGFDPDPSTLRCPICFDTVCRPVVTLCLHVFCDEWIYKSLRDSSLACPICRVSITQPPEPDAILEGHLERAVAECVVAVPSGGRSSPYTRRDVEF
ncbi:hypothetical protein B0H14DRAFT_2601829 [Mycena olivaceomarginata]|nr:hypothetical protein B0H14DRAFT_2601829 [Mycena olivaceomarginata]